MAVLAENLGLGFLLRDKDSVASLLSTVAGEGRSIVGYYGRPAVNRHYGDAQLILSACPHPRQRKIEATGFAIHCAGKCLWEGVFTAAETEKDDPMLRQTEIRFGDRELSVDIVNADVLPCFSPGIAVKLQMIAFPLRLDYTEQPVPPALERLDGGRTALCGRVLDISPGMVQFAEEKKQAFLRCLVDTPAGEIELVHTAEQVSDGQQPLLCAGSFVRAECVLSGDAAINEYENGAVLDEAHDLMLLADVFRGEDSERLRFCLSRDAVYDVRAVDKQYVGRDEIISRLAYVQRQSGGCQVFPAVLTGVEDDGDPSLYAVGKSCLLLIGGGGYKTLAFADMDAAGRISRIVTTADPRYHFRREQEAVTIASVDYQRQ